MVLKGLMKMFGGGDDNATSTAKSGKTPETFKDLENFVDYVVRALVDYPEQVKVYFDKQEDGTNVIKIECNKEDIGKIVGKRGRTIMAIRSLVSGAAGRMEKKVAVEVID